MFELETDERYELWGGEKIVLPLCGTDHESILSNLTGLMIQHVRKNKLGKGFGSSTAVFLHGDVTRKDFRMPDLSFVATERLDRVQQKGRFGAPDLLVEIVSPDKKNADRDLIEKFAIYEQFGVTEYWIVKPYVEEMELYHLRDGKYVRVEQSILFAGIQLAHEEIFE